MGAKKLDSFEAKEGHHPGLRSHGWVRYDEFIGVYCLVADFEDGDWDFLGDPAS
jgi:hypothetical protein